MPAGPSRQGTASSPATPRSPEPVVTYYKATLPIPASSPPPAATKNPPILQDMMEGADPPNH